MGTKKRVNKYPRTFQLMALERMKNCESVSALAQEPEREIAAESRHN